MARHPLTEEEARRLYYTKIHASVIRIEALCERYGFPYLTVVQYYPDHITGVCHLEEGIAHPRLLGAWNLIDAATEEQMTVEEITALETHYASPKRKKE